VADPVKEPELALCWIFSAASFGFVIDPFAILLVPIPPATATLALMFPLESICMKLVAAGVAGSVWVELPERVGGWSVRMFVRFPLLVSSTLPRRTFAPEVEELLTTSTPPLKAAEAVPETIPLDVALTAPLTVS
jgi:hypothetical protein